MSKRTPRTPAAGRPLSGRLLGLLIAAAIVLMYLFVLSRGSWL